ncbi:MAG: hypothetical protein C0521_09415 [Xanthomonas sp.]|nr:hypothetical protein [Xanthomonas sp.]
MLESHEVRGVYDGGIVPGDTDEFHIKHATPVITYSGELVVPHALHHRRHAPLPETLAVHEGLDELAVHAPKRLVTLPGPARGRRRHGHQDRQRHPP